MNNLSILFFLLATSLYGSETTFTTQELLLFLALFLAVALYGYILTLFKKLESLNKNLKNKTKVLHERKERLELALRIGKLGSWDVDFLNNKLVVNEEWLKVVGYEMRDDEVFTNETWISTIHPDDRQRVLDYGKEYKNGFIDEYNLEYRGVTNENKTVWLVSKGAIVQRDANNKPMRMIGVVSDITKEKLLKDSLQQAKNQAEEAVKMKSAFLANMSHEIRTPLNAIIGFIELLKEQEVDKEKQKYLNIVSSSSKNLVDIINDILDFSKMESGKINLEFINFNTYEEFDMTKKLFQARADEKDIKLHLNYVDVPKYIKSDILRIKQIINNLLSNAIKFTPDGKNIYLDMSYKDNTLHISVKDEGIGIKKDKLQYIFEAFNQAESSTSRQYGGTGLGLSISSKLV
ncbi:MAG: PAS domain-containing protein, partial [Campylobacterales bacterium]|nr:PAS domain-containing protein [Campylobacterales bacterium]